MAIGNFIGTAPKTGTTGNSPIVLHTPGPWRTAKSGIFAGHTFLAQVSGGAQIATQAEADANARLIAASPALLGAVVALVFAARDGGAALLALAVRQAIGALALVEGSSL